MHLLMEGKGVEEIRNDKKVASNNIAGFTLIGKVRKLMPEFWHSRISP